MHCHYVGMLPKNTLSTMTLIEFMAALKRRGQPEVCTHSFQCSSQHTHNCTFAQHTKLHNCTFALLPKKHCNKTQINANNTLDKKQFTEKNVSDSWAPSKNPMFSMMTLGRGGSVKKQMTLDGCKRNTWWVHYQLW